jgi:hypothetical protein
MLPAALANAVEEELASDNHPLEQADNEVYVVPQYTKLKPIGML